MILLCFLFICSIFVLSFNAIHRCSYLLFSILVFFYLIFFLVEFSWNVADAQPIRAWRTRTVVSLQPSPIELYDRYVVFFKKIFFVARGCFLGFFLIIFFYSLCFVVLNLSTIMYLIRLFSLQRPKRYCRNIVYERGRRTNTMLYLFLYSKYEQTINVVITHRVQQVLLRGFL